MKRYFAFGCSYVAWQWDTVTDYIGANFDEYYNCGLAGCSNTFMMNKLFDFNEIYKFNSSDFVTIGTTGFGRFSFYNKNSLEWNCNGDIFPEFKYHPELARLWAREFDSHTWAIRRSIDAVKWMRFMLTNLQVPHKIYRSVTNTGWLKNKEQFGLTDYNLELIDQFNNLLDIAESIDDYVIRTNPLNEESGIVFNDGDHDHHPSPLQHYRYFEHYFAEFNTDKAQQRYHESLTNFDRSSRKNQSEKYREYKNKQVKDLKKVNEILWKI